MRITTTSPAGRAHDAWCRHSGAPVDRANASTKPRVASTTTPSVVTPAMSGAPLMRIVHAGAGLDNAVRFVHQRLSTGSGVHEFVATRIVAARATVMKPSITRQYRQFRRRPATWSP